MSKKKRKKASQQNKTAAPVRLSQCMIVKNEEKNIERALQWAKDIAFEQIVVDTGSTDRTVELAEKTGAKVYHFEWINDFSAAKNYAMNLAKGDWIAILDADEYMSREDAVNLMTVLKKIQADPGMSKKCEAITNTFVNLDEKGNTISVISHQRIFRNRPHLRFIGRIHENIKVQDYINVPAIRIIHTGYTQTVHAETKKKDRNIELLRKELEGDTDNPDIMFYLADSIKGAGTKEALEEAENLFIKALKSERAGNKLLKQFAYNFLIPRYIKDENKMEEALKLCNDAVADLPDYIDYYYYRAVLYNYEGNHKAAQDDLTICEKAFLSPEKIPVTLILTPIPLLLFYQSLVAAQGLGDTEEIAKNSTVINMMLRENKENTTVVGSYIRAMLEHGKTDDEVLKELSEVYDPNDPKDILFIARAAKESGAVEFTRNIMKIAERMLGNGY